MGQDKKTEQEWTAAEVGALWVIGSGVSLLLWLIEVCR